MLNVFNPLATCTNVQVILNHSKVARLCRKHGYFEEGTIAQFVDFIDSIENGECFPITTLTIKAIACHILKMSDIDTMINESGMNELQLLEKVMVQIANECVDIHYHLERKNKEVTR